MNKFIKNVLIFMTPILALGISIEILLRNVPNDYAYKKAYLDKNSENIETLFLGNSHAFLGVNPIYIKSSAHSFNAGYVSQSLEYDYKIIEKYKNRWKRLKYLVVSISYPSLFSKLETGGEAWRVKNYSIYYGVKTSNNVSDYFELFSNKLDVNLTRIELYYLLGRINITSSELGWRNDSRLTDNRDLTETGKLAAKRHTSKDSVYFEENMKILDAMIRFANENDVTVIFYTPPAFRTYVDLLDERQLEQTIVAMTRLDNNYQNVVYANFLTDAAFVETDFYNADHLNKIGAKKLTKKIDRLLETMNKP